jgi:hypothetical protein
MIHDETDIIKVKDVVRAITSYLHDEVLIGGDSAPKAESVRNSLAQIASEFAGSVVEASLKLNYTSRVNNYLADLFLHLRWLAKDDMSFMNNIHEVLQRTVAVSQVQIEIADRLLTEFYEQYKSLSLNFISVSKFREYFSAFVAKLIEQIIKKQ